MSDSQLRLRGEIVTIGESLAVFAPIQAGYLRYIRNYELRVAGAESNVAIGVSKLGHKARWVSKLGEDELGEAIVHAIRAEGVDVTGVIRSTVYQTGAMVKQMHSGLETSVFYYRYDSAASHMCTADLDFERMKQASIIHLTGVTAALSECCEELVFAVSEFAVRNGILLSFDPNIRIKIWGDRNYVSVLKALCDRADILLIGFDEANMIYGKSDIHELVKTILSSGRQTYVALKDGSRGAYVADKQGSHYIQPYPCHCVDPIGAGDAFDAAFLCGILEGRSICECGKMGAVAGAYATETNGDIEGYPDKKRMEEAIQGVISHVYR